MRYVSEEDVVKIVASVLEQLDDKCKELPQTQWQTIEEFKANPVDGCCWCYCESEKNVFIHYYTDERFYTDSNSEELITHVMPIKTPEAPK